MLELDTTVGFDKKVVFVKMHKEIKMGTMSTYRRLRDSKTKQTLPRGQHED
jgi:hypothetical protein